MSWLMSGVVSQWQAFVRSHSVDIGNLACIESETTNVETCYRNNGMETAMSRGGNMKVKPERLGVVGAGDKNE